MNLRDINIGPRLGLGFGAILLAASALLVGALLSSAVAVRNMGLQTAVEGVQKDETEAKRQRAACLAAKSKLEATERELFGRLADIDSKMDAFSRRPSIWRPSSTPSRRARSSPTRSTRCSTRPFPSC